MCLIALAIDANRRFPLVVAANRDEYLDRPAAGLDWWTPVPGGPEVLAGRDLAAGGTWLGLTAAGRLAMLTNVRRPWILDPAAPSRGGIATAWLATEEAPELFWARTAIAGHAPFNLIAADLWRGDCFWASNAQALPQRLEHGLHGLSNAALDTPWPKVVTLKARLGDALDTADSVDGLAATLLRALRDRACAPDEALPATGIGLDRERLLSPAFIETPDGRYGTRCSTLVITERTGRSNATHVIELTHGHGTRPDTLRRTLLRHWPPRRGGTGPAPPAEAAAVIESNPRALPGLE